MSCMNRSPTSWLLAAIDELLFDAAQFGKFRKDCARAQCRQQVGGVTDRRDSPRSPKIRRNLRTSIPRTISKAARESAAALFASTRPCKRLPDRLAHHRRFRSALCCSRINRGLLKFGSRLLISSRRILDLRVLAPKAQDRRARHIGMMDVSGDQTA